MDVRFDDALRTVLASDTDTAFGAASAWRQLVDLAGRGRIPASDPVIERLRGLRALVPAEVRAASARALAFTSPPAALVALFAEEPLGIAAPVLRTAALGGQEWAGLIGRLSPAGRSILRHRRDLPPDAVAALRRYQAGDFLLEHEHSADEPARSAATNSSDPVEESREHADERADAPPRFEIAELVARIEAFNRDREARPAVTQASVIEPEDESDRFDFETDASGAIIWVHGAPRGALIGVSIAHGPVDGLAAGAFRGRTAFQNARLTIGGDATVAGSWRMSAVPRFDPKTGRFTGFRGAARRPRADEDAGHGRTPAADSLRQLVHELRTPTNAITGFAELIESEVLGPVPPIYRARAGAIRAHAADLIAAIEDLDTAARIEGGALELRPGTAALAPLLHAVKADLAALARLRGAVLDVAADPALVVAADDRAVGRLVARLLAALVSAGAAGETIAVRASRDADRALVVIDRPVALKMVGDEALLSIDAERDGEEAVGAPLLGTGFALRLARNLAVELGGTLAIESSRLTLRLPAASDGDMGQASSY